MKMLEGGAGVLIGENPTPKFKFFVHLIEQSKLPDGITASAYYGEIKAIITAFMNYFTSVIDETGKKINKYSHFIANKLLVDLIDDTVAKYTANHATFLEQYQPLNSEEKENYQRVIENQATFIKELAEMRETWEIKHDKLDIFMKKTLDAAMQKISDLCNFAHTYISMMLADRVSIFHIDASVFDAPYSVFYYVL